MISAFFSCTMSRFDRWCRQAEETARSERATADDLLEMLKDKEAEIAHLRCGLLAHPGVYLFWLQQPYTCLFLNNN